MLNFLPVFLWSVAIVRNDAQCVENIGELEECLKKKEDNTNVVTIKNNIKKCFTDNKCEAPNLDPDHLHNSSTEFHVVDNYIAELWTGLPESDKQCLRKNIAHTLFDKANKCLNVFETVMSENNKADDSLAILDSLMYCRRNDPGAGKTNATLQCVSKIQKDLKKEVCKRIQLCRREKFSETCNKRRQEMNTGFCQCDLDDLQKLKTAIEKYRGSRQPVLAVVSGITRSYESDWKNLEQAVSTCFNETHKLELDEDIILYSLILNGYNVLGSKNLFPLILQNILLPADHNSHGVRNFTSDDYNFLNNYANYLIMNTRNCACKM